MFKRFEISFLSHQFFFLSSISLSQMKSRYSHQITAVRCQTSWNEYKQEKTEAKESEKTNLFHG